MAAIVSKIGATGCRSSERTARKNRVARVTAKRPQAHEKDEPRPEAELDAEALADDGEDEVAEKPARPDSGTYLSMYFRDMAVLDVLRPEEEFTSAREIEALEIMLWEAVLAHAPAVEPHPRRGRGSSRLRHARRGQDAAPARRRSRREGIRARSGARRAQAARGGQSITCSSKRRSARSIA